jgi:hypothetical protein
MRTPITILLLAASLTGFCQQPILVPRTVDPATEPRYSALMDRYFVLKDAIAQADDLKTLQSLQMQLDDVNEKLSEANIAALHEHTAQFQALLPAMTAAMRPKRRHWWRLR